MLRPQYASARARNNTHLVGGVLSFLATIATSVGSAVAATLTWAAANTQAKINFTQSWAYKRSILLGRSGYGGAIA